MWRGHPAREPDEYGRETPVDRRRVGKGLTQMDETPARSNWPNLETCETPVPP